MSPNTDIPATNVHHVDTPQALLFIGNSFLSGLSRIHRARIFFFKLLSYALPMYAGTESSGKEDQENSTTFKYVTDVGHFVYTVSLFDSFLTDITRLLLLNNPAALGEDCRVPIGILTSPSARAKVLNQEISKRVKDVAYRGISQRLKFLRRQFDLKFDVSAYEEALEQMFKRRNELVHEHSIYGYELDADGKPLVKVKGETSELYPISNEDILYALDVCVEVAVTVYKSISQDICGIPPGADIFIAGYEINYATALRQRMRDRYAARESAPVSDPPLST